MYGAKSLHTSKVSDISLRGLSINHYHGHAHTLSHPLCGCSLCSDSVWITWKPSAEKNIRANCCVCVFGEKGGGVGYKQVRTPSSINPATNCFDQFVVSIQFKSSPWARVCMCVILFINCKLVFGLWLQLSKDCRLELDNVQFAIHTHAQTLYAYVCVCVGGGV